MATEMMRYAIESNHTWTLDPPPLRKPMVGVNWFLLAGLIAKGYNGKLKSVVWIAVILFPLMLRWCPFVYSCL